MGTAETMMSKDSSPDLDAWAQATSDVTPLKGNGKVQRKPSAKPATAPVAPPSAPVVRSGAPTAPVARSRAATALDALAREHAALVEQHAALRAEHASAHAALAALRIEVEHLESAREALRRERDALQFARGGLERERDALQAKPEVSEVTPRALSGDWLTDVQRVSVLERLVRLHPKACARALTCDLQGASARALDAHIAVACRPCAQRLADDAIVVDDVPSARCEVCGGSDTQRAFRDFVAACGLADVDRVIVLGGSPTYRAEVQRLVDGAHAAPKFTFVGEGNKPGAKKALASARHKDLLVLWTNTMIDHTTTAAFNKAKVRRVIVTKRGIGSMFAQVTEALTSGEPLA